MREFNIRRHAGGKVIAGSMDRPTKHDQDGSGDVRWWDAWNSKWITAPYDSCRHGARYTKWSHTEDYAERQK